MITGKASRSKKNNVVTGEVVVPQAAVPHTIDSGAPGTVKVVVPRSVVSCDVKRPVNRGGIVSCVVGR